MKNRKYLDIDQFVFKKEGWSKELTDKFIDRFIELVEEFEGETQGSFSLLTEKQFEEAMIIMDEEDDGSVTNFVPNEDGYDFSDEDEDIKNKGPGPGDKLH